MALYGSIQTYLPTAWRGICQLVLKPLTTLLVEHGWLKTTPYRNHSRIAVIEFHTTGKLQGLPARNINFEEFQISNVPMSADHLIAGG